MRARVIEEKMGIHIYKNNGSTDFKTAIWMLNSLNETLKDSKNPRVLEELRLCASRYFNQMDIVLNKDEDYQLAKKGL